jgi:hypothetical protein
MDYVERARGTLSCGTLSYQSSAIATFACLAFQKQTSTRWDDLWKRLDTLLYQITKMGICAYLACWSADCHAMPGDLQGAIAAAGADTRPDHGGPSARPIGLDPS